GLCHNGTDQITDQRDGLLRVVHLVLRYDSRVSDYIGHIEPAILRRPVCELNDELMRWPEPLAESWILFIPTNQVPITESSRLHCWHDVWDLSPIAKNQNAAIFFQQSPCLNHHHSQHPNQS